jgi:nucleotide-binding universal stress UspA family protein
MREPVPYRRILALVNFDAQDTHVFHQARVLAKASGAQLRLLHIVDVDPALDGGVNLTPEQEAHAYKAVVMPRLQSMAQAAEGVRIECHVRIGRPAPTLQQFAHDWTPDLVVTTRRAQDIAHGPWDVLILSAPSTSWLSRLKRWSINPVANLTLLAKTA